VNLRPFLWGFEPGLYERLEQFRVSEEQMPEEYQLGHRPLRDDWALFKGTTRRECYRRIPLPFKIVGPSHKEWIPWSFDYPLSPGHDIMMRDYTTAWGTFSIPHVYADVGDYGLCRYLAWIDNEWRYVHMKFTMKTPFGRRFSAYRGLHQDLHVSPPDQNGKRRWDLGGWIEPPTASWVKEV
jgi:hypothetical protein